MEGIPSVPMISFPVRRCVDDGPNFKQKLNTFISHRCKETSDLYIQEIAEFDSLRTSAIHHPRNQIGCSVLAKYFCQLNFLKWKLHEEDSSTFKFSWYDIYSDTIHDWSDIDSEMSCILYNIGALHSEIAAIDDRRTSDGMQMSCEHFQYAAWAFQHLREYPNVFIPDIFPDLVSIATNICLAQAQECIWEKSLTTDKRKLTDGYTAKLALQIVEYYFLSLRTSEQVLEDSGQYSDELIKAVKNMKKLIEIKIPYYSSIVFFYRGRQSENQQKWGECITFYRTAKERLNCAIKLADTLDKTDSVHETLAFAIEIVDRKLSVAENENDFFYQDKIPDLNDISMDTKGISVVKGIPIKFNDTTVMGQDIFSRLVSIGGHKVPSVCSDEKAKLDQPYSNKSYKNVFFTPYHLDKQQTITSTPPLSNESCVTPCAQHQIKTNSESQDIANCSQQPMPTSDTSSTTLFPKYLSTPEFQISATESYMQERKLSTPAINSAGNCAATTNSQRVTLPYYPQQNESSTPGVRSLPNARPFTEYSVTVPKNPTMINGTNVNMFPTQHVNSASMAAHIDKSSKVVKLHHPTINYYDQQNVPTPTSSSIHGVSSGGPNVQYPKTVSSQSPEVLTPKYLSMHDLRTDLQNQLYKLQGYSQYLSSNSTIQGLMQPSVSSHLLPTTSSHTQMSATSNVLPTTPSSNTQSSATSHLLPAASSNTQSLAESRLLPTTSSYTQPLASTNILPSASTSMLLPSLSNTLPSAPINMLLSASSNRLPLSSYIMQSSTPYNSQASESFIAQPSVSNNSQPATSYNTEPSASYNFQNNIGKHWSVSYIDQLAASSNIQHSVSYNDQLAASSNIQHSVSCNDQLAASSNIQHSVSYNDQLAASSNMQHSVSYNDQLAASSNIQHSISYNDQLAGSSNIKHSLSYNDQLAASSNIQHSVSCNDQLAASSNIQHSVSYNDQFVASSNMQHLVSYNQQQGQNYLQPSLHTYHFPATRAATNSQVALALNIPGVVSSQISQQSLNTIAPTKKLSKNTNKKDLFLNLNSKLTTAIYNQSASQAPFFNRNIECVTPDDSPLVPTTVSYVTTAYPAQPPNWEQSCDEAIQALSPFYKILVDEYSEEYRVISDMITCTKISKIERVVNTELWKKFKNTRKDILCSKSDDLELLKSLGLSDKEIVQRAHANMNFDKEPAILEYSDNIALLFHGTRGNVDAVLSQGLDERLGNSTGLLGRGIYFADDPQKSMSYDTQGILLIFAVFLGDCYSVDHIANKNSFVREPEKTNKQRRNHTDLFFDSIVGRPSSVNEYVIYNRNQCCPLYAVTYNKLGIYTSLANFFQPLPNSQTLSNTYTSTRTNFPPFVWMPPNATNWFRRSNERQWSFYAQTIFDLMKKDQIVEAVTSPRFQSEESDESVALKLSTLFDLGFMDDQANMKTLNRFGYNLERTIDHLLELPTPVSSDPIGTLGAVSSSPISGSKNYPAAGFIDVTESISPIPKIGEQQKPSSVLSTKSSPANSPGVVPRKKAVKRNSRQAKSCSTNSISTLSTVIHPTIGGLTTDKKNVVDQLDTDTAPKNRFLTLLQGKSKTKITSKKQKIGPSSKKTDTIVLNTDNDGPLVSNCTSPLIPIASVTLPFAVKEEECTICCVEFPCTLQQWQYLKCGHKLCNKCYSRLETKGTTMAGQGHTFIKCPFCQSCSGQEIGTCPNGTMHVTSLSHYLPGYEKYITTVIQYIVPDRKYPLKRTAYLPNSPEGNKVLNLLRIAWDRRLCFSIGTSMTTGRKDVLVWNIHHKTAIQGGVGCHGYPDPTYLDRVLDELKQYGLE